MRKWLFTFIACFNLNTTTSYTVPIYCVTLPEIVVVAKYYKPKMTSNRPNYVVDYIDSTYALADTVSKQYGVPIEIIFGIACLEGYYGKSKWARVNNNHFGIVKGKKHFATKSACFHYLGNLLSNTKRYKSLVGETNIDRYCIKLRETGYNSKETYPKKLSNMIQYLSPLLKNR